MAFSYSRKSKSEEETIVIADEFSNYLQPGMIIVLNGDLGTGKTFFTKQILKRFGVSNSNSPTFAIVNSYYGNYTFYHFDFYRINKKEELHDIGIEDYFNDEQSIIFIEWGNLFPKVIPHKHIEIIINFINENEREFIFKEYD